MPLFLFMGRKKGKKKTNNYNPTNIKEIGVNYIISENAFIKPVTFNLLKIKLAVYK